MVLAVGADQFAIALPLAGAELAFVARAVRQGLDAEAVQRIAMKVAGLHEPLSAHLPAHSRPLEAAIDEIALGMLDAGFFAHAQAGRPALAPLPLVARAVRQAHRAEPVQPIVLPLSRLMLTGIEVGDAQPLTQPARCLADIGRPIGIGDTLGILEAGTGGTRGGDSRFAGSRTGGIGGILRLGSVGTRLLGGMLGLAD